MWLLKTKGEEHYDEARGYVVVAFTEARARELSWKEAGQGQWLSSAMTSCEAIAEIVPELNDLYDPTERIVLEDRLHG